MRDYGKDRIDVLAVRLFIVIQPPTAEELELVLTATLQSSDQKFDLIMKRSTSLAVSTQQREAGPHCDG